MSGEKTEEPTEQKLQKSREEGQVAKSQDLAMAISLLGVMLALLLMGSQYLDHLRSVMRTALDFADGNLPLDELYKRMGSMVIDAMWIIGPLAAAAALFAAVGTFGHIGLSISAEPVIPNPEKVNPAAGLQRLFSMKSMMDFLQMVFKALVLMVVLWQFIVHLVPLIASAPYQSAEGIGTIAWSAITKLFGAALLLFMVLGPLDFGIQRWMFMRDQRMSKDDIKREYKENEGDPMVKGQRMALARELAESDPRPSVAGANAVIVNPTHYAVAVRYRPNECSLPVIVAKGLDQEALLIRQLAEASGVPVFSNPPLARSLHEVALNSAVPEELFAPIAAILRWVNEIGVRAEQRAAH
jgi:type III secretion protein U